MVARLIITGSVQGVGYRQFVKSHAQKLGLTGWVRNMPDGSVYALLEGEKTIIQQFIALCYQGPFLAEVQKIQTTWLSEEKKYASFEVVTEKTI